MPAPNRRRLGQQFFQHTSLRQKISVALVGAFALALIVLFSLQETATLSHCSSCDVVISDTDNSNFNFSSAQTICIAPGGKYTGKITRWSGSGLLTICNEGEFKPKEISLGSGENTIDNYGSMVLDKHNFTQGTQSMTLNNHPGASFEAKKKLQLYTSHDEINNFGTWESKDIELSNGPGFTNHATGQLAGKKLKLNNGSSFTNLGNATFSNQVELNQNSSLANAGDLVLNHFLKINSSSQLTNTGQVEVQGKVDVNSSASLINEYRLLIGQQLTINGNGLTNLHYIDIGQHLRVNGGGYLVNKGLIDVEQHFWNYNQVTGPTPAEGGYGRINVEGQTTNSGQLLNNLDICDAGSPSNGLDQNWGSTASTVTFCTNNSSISLPVELTDFQLTAAPGKVVLRWETAQEVNNEHFSVERSADGTQFEGILELAGAGNSSRPQAYSASDPSPLSGLNYYRLKQVDFDGSFTYSQVLSTSFALEGYGASLFPNPANDQTRLRLLSPESWQGQVVVSDLNGRVWLRQPVDAPAGSTEIALNLSPLSSGMYVVQVQHPQRGEAFPSLRLMKR